MIRLYRLWVGVRIGTTPVEGYLVQTSSINWQTQKLHMYIWEGLCGTDLSALHLMFLLFPCTKELSKQQVRRQGHGKQRPEEAGN